MPSILSGVLRYTDTEIAVMMEEVFMLTDRSLFENCVEPSTVETKGPDQSSPQLNTAVGWAVTYAQPAGCSLPELTYDLWLWSQVEVTRQPSSSTGGLESNLFPLHDLYCGS